MILEGLKINDSIWIPLLFAKNIDEIFWLNQTFGSKVSVTISIEWSQ
jgi:hypothetical protein